MRHLYQRLDGSGDLVSCLLWIHLETWQKQNEGELRNATKEGAYGLRGTFLFILLSPIINDHWQRCFEIIIKNGGSTQEPNISLFPLPTAEGGGV